MTLFLIAAIAHIGLMCLCMWGRSKERYDRPDANRGGLRNGSRKKKDPGEENNVSEANMDKIVQNKGVDATPNMIRNRKRSMPLTKYEIDVSKSYQSLSLSEVTNDIVCDGVQDIPNAAKYQEPEGIGPMIHDEFKGHTARSGCDECVGLAREVSSLKERFDEFETTHMMS